LYVRNALIDVYREGQQNNLPPDQSKPFVFNASIDFLGSLPEHASMNLKLTDSSGRTVLNAPLEGVYNNNETVTGSTIIQSSCVQLWWPNGMGDQILYNATITVQDASGQTVATVERRVGFRTIVLNLTPISQEQLSLGIAPGANWHFEINGNEFYAKGSNLVPPDVFWPHVDETKMQRLFEVVQAAEMNMLRVWSSGAYLPDWIYDLADEMGILLWSEFEFSDAEYPVYPDFLANYEAEAYYNVRRVNHHPSLALWVGGNELEQIILDYFFSPSNALLQYYELIQQELLIKCVYANSRSISYIPSS
jgi:beta-mannosidase